MYVYHQTTNAGNPIEVFVPDEDGLEFNARGRSVMSVVDTVKEFEQRSWQDVLADMLATDPTRAPQNPPVSAA